MKRYYDREEELRVLAKESQLVAKNKKSRLAVITGRRRVGKTELLLHAAKEMPGTFIYLFSTRTQKETLIEDWAKTICDALGIAFPPKFDRLSKLIEYLLFLAKDRQINVAIDECQDISYIEPSFWSEVQKCWDLQRKDSLLFLMMSGSIASAMRNIFQEYSEPLYGRVDRLIQVRPFGAKVLCEILDDYSPSFDPDDLLALYTLTGGVAWFVEDLMERGACRLEDMADVAFSSGSKFMMDGEILLANEFRADANLNRGILQAIAEGVTKREELQNRFSSIQIAGALSRLENQYEMIAKNAPVLEHNYRKSRYKMRDRYLMFWFTFVQSNRRLIECNDFAAAKRIFLSNYETFSGRALEQYFTEKFRAEASFITLGGWWDRKGGNEIDLIAENERSVFIFEIKRNRNKINLKELGQKSEAFLTQHPKLREKAVHLGGLSLMDMKTDVRTLLAVRQNESNQNLA